MGKGITSTCHESYDRADTKLGPEAFRFSEAIEARALKQNERSVHVRKWEKYFPLLTVLVDILLIFFIYLKLNFKGAFSNKWTKIVCNTPSSAFTVGSSKPIK